MSVEFENKFTKFNRWNEQHRNCQRDLGMDVKYIHAALDKVIELVECANKDLQAYEKKPVSRLLI